MSTFGSLVTGCQRLGEIPTGSSIMDLKERAAVAAQKAEQHRSSGHTALARSWQNAATRLRKELQSRLRETSLGGLRKGIPLAHWDGSTLRVGTTPVLSPDQLNDGVLDTDKNLGELRRETKNARVWVKGAVVTVQWPGPEGWRIINQYRVPARDSLGELEALGLGEGGKKLIIGIAAAGALAYGARMFTAMRRRSQQVAERAEET